MKENAPVDVVIEADEESTVPSDKKIDPKPSFHSLSTIVRRRSSRRLSIVQVVDVRDFWSGSHSQMVLAEELPDSRLIGTVPREALGHVV